MSRGRSGLFVLAAAGAVLVAAVVYLSVAGTTSAPVTGTGGASPRPLATPSAKSSAPAPRAATPSSAVPATAPDRPAETGRLRIVADVPGAAVFFDHKFVGRAPVEVGDVVLGSHRLNVSAEAREMYAETFETGRGPRTVIVRLQPVRLDESVDVVHRHGIGSCEGRLSATLAGLRYETADKDDAFARPFGDLEPLGDRRPEEEPPGEGAQRQDVQLHDEGQQRRRSRKIPAEGRGRPEAPLKHRYALSASTVSRYRCPRRSATSSRASIRPASSINPIPTA